MKKEIIPEKKKLSGLSYAFMDNGLEIPVIDISHPLFKASIDEKKLSEYMKKAASKGEKRAESFKKMPLFLKNFLVKRSFIMANLLSDNNDDKFLSGLSTLLLKMGPYLIGGGRKRFFDRLASKGIGGIVLRMRLRDIAASQANQLKNQLIEFPEKNLCFINIAGGTSCDTINTILLILEGNPDLLKNRKIEINVLDIDSTGPEFAEKSIRALKTGTGKFHNLNISFRYFNYNWENTTILKNLISERKECLLICTSEGGLFEYGTDEDIIKNLEAISENSGGDIKAFGSVIRDKDTIDPGTIVALKMTRIKARLLGIEGLKTILKKTQWNLDNHLETNPRYIVFSLKLKR
jgi:hypothetical protein